MEINEQQLWLNVCTLLEVDPATVKQPKVVVAPDLLSLFGGDSLMYHPGDNAVLSDGSHDFRQLAHEFAHAVIHQSPKFTEKDTEHIPRWVDEKIWV